MDNNNETYRRKKKIWKMAADLSEVPDISEEQAKLCATVLVDKEYRRERHAKWILDTECTSVAKVKYVCSLCNFFQLYKRRYATQFLYSYRYCSSCGARMDKPEEAATEEEV